MKKNNGITLIALIVLIVVIIILAGVSIYYGTQENINTAYETDMYTEVKNVSEAVQQRYLLHRANPSLYKYVGINLASNSKEINGITYSDGWYHLLAENLTDLNLENVTNEYIVNYSTGEVVSTSPIVYKGKKYYSSSEIFEVIGGMYGINIGASENTFNEEKGVNKPKLITGMIPVKNVNGNWFVTTEDDTSWYDYSADNKVWANVMFLDEITISSNYSNEAIRNASLDDLAGLQIITPGSMFVWLPRHSTNGSTVVYSRLLQDYLETGFSVPESFNKNDTQKTGIWISKYDSDYTQ